MTKRGDVSNSLPAFYLATGAGGSASATPRPMAVQMSASPYVQIAPHHHHHHSQSLGPAYSLQPYATYSHGVLYQPVMVPPMLFQSGVGMMLPTGGAAAMTPMAQHMQQQQQQGSSHNVAETHQRVSRRSAMPVLARY